MLGFWTLLCGLGLALGASVRVSRNIANNNCGLQSGTLSNPFIVGGVEAAKHSWPWMASLTRYGSHICGATLISANYAITAAHCVAGSGNTSPYRLVLGSHLRSSTENNQVTVAITRMRRHVNYNSNTLVNDIAMLELSSPVSFNSDVYPACIANTSPSTGTDVTVTGWGTLSSGGSSPDELREVTVPIVSHSQCNSWNGGVDQASMICAGVPEGGKDSCQGDSGGPLVWNVGGRYYLAGVVSWGYGCAGAQKPGVYARVSNYIGWIKEFSDVV